MLPFSGDEGLMKSCIGLLFLQSMLIVFHQEPYHKIDRNLSNLVPIIFKSAKFAYVTKCMLIVLKIK